MTTTRNSNASASSAKLCHGGWRANQRSLENAATAVERIAPRGAVLVLRLAASKDQW